MDWIRDIIKTDPSIYTHVPFVIHFLLPLTIQNLPSSVFFAVVMRPKTSLPACASEIARQMSFLPERTSGTTLALSSSEPKFNTGGRPITVPPSKPEIREVLGHDQFSCMDGAVYHHHILGLRCEQFLVWLWVRGNSRTWTEIRSVKWRNQRDEPLLA